ncbi:hypothetical protein YC2023_010732 [Brassica napus]
MGISTHKQKLVFKRANGNHRNWNSKANPSGKLPSNADTIQAHMISRHMEPKPAIHKRQTTTEVIMVKRMNRGKSINVGDKSMV